MQRTEGNSLVTRRSLFARAAGAAGALAALSAAGPSVAQASAPAQARLTGKLQVVQVLDFHPDHNAFLKKAIEDFAADQRWDLDLSDLNAFLGSSNIYDKLQAQKAAGQPVDVIIHHGLGARQEWLYDLTRDAKDLVTRAAAKFGQPFAGARGTWVIDDKWMSLPYYVRAEGYWYRTDKFEAAGIADPATALSSWQALPDVCMAISSPAQKFYGWGNTVNRCGDGEYLIQNVMYAWGGALADPSGQLVTLFSPEMIDAMTWLADLYMNPKYTPMLPPGVTSWNDTGNNEAWLAGTVGFSFNAGTLYAKSVFDGTTLADGTKLADVTGVVQAPIGPYGMRMQTSSGASFHFMNGSRNFDPASQLAEHLLTPEMQQPLWQTSWGYVLPAYENLWDDPIVAGNMVAQSFKPVAFLDPPFVGISHRGPVTEAAAAVGDQNVLTDMMGDILGGKPVVAAVRDAHLRAVDIYQSLGFQGR